jgi:hypothetical protein
MFLSEECYLWAEGPAHQRHAKTLTSNEQDNAQRLSMGGIMHAGSELSRVSRKTRECGWNLFYSSFILSSAFQKGAAMYGGTGRSFLRMLAGVSARLLGIAGVMSTGCYQAAEPTYGVPSLSVTLTGTVRSEADSTAIEGISIRAFCPRDSLVVGNPAYTGQNGEYYLHVEDYGFHDTDSIGISASDVDGDLNGSFLDADTVLALPQVEEPEVSADILLQPDGN